MDNIELYLEEQRQIALDTKKEIADLVTFTEKLVDIYKAPSDKVEVSGSVEVNTEKEVAIKDIEGIYNSFLMLGDRLTEALEKTSYKPLESVTVKNIDKAKADKVEVTNQIDTTKELKQLQKEIASLKKDFIATVEQLDLNVNVEKQDLPKKATEPISVRLSDGKGFYNSYTQPVIVSSGGNGVFSGLAPSNYDDVVLGGYDANGNFTTADFYYRGKKVKSLELTYSGTNMIRARKVAL